MSTVGEIGDDGGGVNDQAFEAQPLIVSSFYIYTSLLLHLGFPPPTSVPLSFVLLFSCLLRPLSVILPMEQVTSVGDDVGEVQTLQEINPDWRVGPGMDSKEIEIPIEQLGEGVPQR
ncbi:hypothetical protein Ancab_023552 [Ancistrocladus abbreviatus]